MPFGKIPSVMVNDDVVSSDEEIDQKFDYGLTFNIASGVRVNRKKWENYEPKDQLILILRVVPKYCAIWDVEIDWSRLVIEQCPRTKNMHLHCFVTASVGDLTACQDALNREYNPIHDNGYVTCYCEEIYDANGWEDYLKKNQRD